MSIRDPEFPYDERTQIQIKEFYTKFAGKIKKTEAYNYKISDTGNLELYSKESNELHSTMPLYYYRSYSKEEFDDM